jgi:glyceraldehyde 3-phosphate dehydrogenase
MPRFSVNKQKKIKESVMAVRVAINGFGRIGRNVLRAIYERGCQKEVQVVSINDLCPIETSVHLLKYGSVHGRFPVDIEAHGDDMMVAGDHIKMCGTRDATQLPWAQMDVDIVLECTGIFASLEKAKVHLNAGARKVLISAPAGNDVKTIVFGVNDDILTADDVIVSNASCTTNCLAPLVKPIHDAIGVKRGLMTTIHSYTNDQRLTDAYHKDIRRARAGALSMIPTKTGAAAAVGLVLPELAGKLDGFAIRVPTPNVSMVDLTFEAARATSADEINAALKAAAKGPLKGVLGYSDEPLVSIDYNHCALSSVYDSLLTRQVDNMFKVVSWYDNEWGFSNRMIDTALAMHKARKVS